MRRPAPTPEELLDRALEHGAVLQYALRHLAAAWHRKHAHPGEPSWVCCPDHFCEMAHDAVEGRVKPGKRTRWGTVTTLARTDTDEADEG